MRTTLTIDDDLAGILKRKAREMGKPFKELVNTALRKGLAESMTNAPQRVVARPHDFGSSQAGFDWDHLNQLVDELQVEDYVSKEARDDFSGR
jgi:hypothetical protein